MPMWLYGVVIALVLLCLGIVGVLIMIAHRRSRHRATDHRLESGGTYLKKEPVKLEHHDSQNSRIVFEDYIPLEFLIKRDRLTMEQTLGGGAAGVVRAGKIGNSIRVAIKEVHLRLGMRTFWFSQLACNITFQLLLCFVQLKQTVHRGGESAKSYAAYAIRIVSHFTDLATTRLFSCSFKNCAMVET